MRWSTALGKVTAQRGPGSDLTCAEPLIEAGDPGALIADKAFDADAFIAAISDRAITPVIPSKSNRKTPRPCVSPSTANAISSSVSQYTQAFPRRRHALRQTRQDFPCRRSPRLRHHPPQMNTGPNKNLLSIVRRAGAKHQSERIPFVRHARERHAQPAFRNQGEQRLNALNPQADPRNQRIYSFEVVDRENYILALESPIGRPIGSKPVAVRSV